MDRKIKNLHEQIVSDLSKVLEYKHLIDLEIKDQDYLKVASCREQKDLFTKLLIEDFYELQMIYQQSKSNLSIEDFLLNLYNLTSW